MPTKLVWYGMVWTHCTFADKLQLWALPLAQCALASAPASVEPKRLRL